MNLNDLEGVWILKKPIQAEMQLARSGNAVSGTYRNFRVEGTIDGTLTTENGAETTENEAETTENEAETTENEADILTGIWRDQLGEGDFRVAFAASHDLEDGLNPAKCVFYGKWKHSTSRDWDGVFEGEKRASH
ncbi:MAG: hypothetical protein AB9879_00090 [Methanothrix sp.]